MALSSTFVCTVVLSTFWSVTFSTFCPGVKRDLVILLDDSGSLTSDDFIQGKDFLEDFIKQLDVGRDGYQVAVVKFSDRVRLIADLLKPKDDLIKRIRGIIHYGGATHTGKALDFSLRRVFKKNNRDDVPDQILVLTDGDSDDKDETLKQIEKAHAQNIQSIAVGIGDKVSGDKLRSLASGDDLVFMVNNFSVLDSIRDTLLVASCAAETTTTTSSTTLLSTSTDTTATKTTVTTSMTPTLAGTILTAAVKSAPPTSKTVTVTKTKTPSNRTTAVKSIPSTTVTTTTEAPTTPVTETTADTPPPPLTTTTTSAKTSNRQTATTETITTSTTITATPVEIPTQSTRITTANRPIATTKAALTTLTSTKSTGTAPPKTLTRNDKRLWYVVGGTVAAFVLACIAVGLVVLIIKNYTSKKQQSVMEVL